MGKQDKHEAAKKVVAWKDPKKATDQEKSLVADLLKDMLKKKGTK